MEKAKKILMWATIALTIFVAFALICSLFDFDIFGNRQGDALLILGSFAVGGFFAINSLIMVPKNKIIGWLSLGLIALAVVLITVVTLVEDASEVWQNITVSFGILSVVFDLIASMGLDLGKKYFAFQIVIYILAVVLDVLATLLIFGAIAGGDATLVLIAGIIVEIVLIVVVKVLNKKTVAGKTEGMVTISKEEYDILKEKAEKFDKIQAAKEVGDK